MGFKGLRLCEAGEGTKKGEGVKMGKILLWPWLIFSAIVIGKAYYETFKDILGWVKKKIHKAREESKEDVESTD